MGSTPGQVTVTWSQCHISYNLLYRRLSRGYRILAYLSVAVRHFPLPTYIVLILHPLADCLPLSKVTLGRSHTPFWARMILASIPSSIPKNTLLGGTVPIRKLDEAIVSYPILRPSSWISREVYWHVAIDCIHVKQSKLPLNVTQSKGGNYKFCRLQYPKAGGGYNVICSDILQGINCMPEGRFSLWPVELHCRY